MNFEALGTFSKKLIFYKQVFQGHYLENYFISVFSVVEYK